MGPKQSLVNFSSFFNNLANVFFNHAHATYLFISSFLYYFWIKFSFCFVIKIMPHLGANQWLPSLATKQGTHVHWPISGSCAALLCRHDISPEVEPLTFSISLPTAPNHPPLHNHSHSSSLFIQSLLIHSHSSSPQGQGSRDRCQGLEESPWGI